MWPSIPFGGALCAISSGLFYTFSPSTSVAKIVGYQILAGVGFGSVLNVMIVIVQADYTSRPGIEPHATAVQNWAGFLGRIIGITVATNIFENKVSRSIPVFLNRLFAEILLDSSSPVWKVLPICPIS